MDRRQWIRQGLRAASAAVLAAMLLIAPARAQPNAARVTLYSVSGLGAFYRAVLPGFEQSQHVQVNLVILGSAAMAERLAAERAQPQADVIVALPPFVAGLDAAGLLRRVVVPADAQIDAVAQADDHSWRAMALNYVCFITDSTLADAAPESIDGLQSPAFKGKLLYNQPKDSADGMAMLVLVNALLGDRQGFALLKKLEPSVAHHPASRASLARMLAERRGMLAFGDLQMALTLARQGVAVEPVFLAGVADGRPTTFALPYAIALAKDAPEAAAGRRLLDYLLSRAVQAQLAGFDTLPARNDVVALGAQADTLRGWLGEARIITANWPFVAEVREGWLRRWHNIAPVRAAKPAQAAAR
jgi:2-aminoethylphosphonate transport system substrate-binding protein